MMWIQTKFEGNKFPSMFNLDCLSSIHVICYREDRCTVIGVTPNGVELDWFKGTEKECEAFLDKLSVITSSFIMRR